MMLLKTTYSATAFFLCMLLLLPSCSNETEIEGGHTYTGKKVALSIQMETRDATDPDLEIDGVRAIVFTGDGELVYNGVPDPVTGSTDGSYVVKVKAAHGINHVYIICNETTELTGKLDGIATQSDIEDITFNAAGITGTPPMYGKVKDAFVKARSDGSQATVTVSGVTSNELAVTVNRMVARLGFTAIKNVDTSTQEDFKVTKIGIRVCRMPKQTTIREGQAYTADEWSDERLIEQTGLLDNNGAYDIDQTDGAGHYIYTIPNDINSILLPDTYIPEHILSNETDASRATYLKIEAECQLKNGSIQILRGIYLLNIGQDLSKNYNLVRNNYYHIYATITGLGALGIYAEVVAMEEHDITINWEPIDGLVIVSDKSADYDTDAGTSKNINIWDDYTVYSGILKSYHAATGYKDIVFKYGSLIAVNNDQKSSTGTPFSPPDDSGKQNDIQWSPGSYDATAIRDWAGIPYRQADDIPATNSTEEVAKALGDPCRLVGLSSEQIRVNGIVDNQQWHMATRDEYQNLINAQDNVVRTGGYGTYHYLLLPYVNYRDESGQTAGDVGKGQFWTTTEASAFTVDGTSGSFADNQDKQRGYTVRCVRNTIPDNSMKTTINFSVTYKGGAASFYLESNVPYWTATLIEEGDNVGSATDFDEISFKKDEDAVHIINGSYSQNVFAYIKRKESQTRRTFRVKVEGFGLNGSVAGTIATVVQNGYEYKGGLTFDKVVDPVPQAGGDYTVTVNLTPEDIAAPAGKLQLSVVYLNVQQTISAEVKIDPAKHSYQIPLKINQNLTPDMIGITVVLILKRDGMADTRIGTQELKQKGTK